MIFPYAPPPRLRVLAVCASFFVGVCGVAVAQVPDGCDDRLLPLFRDSARVLPVHSDSSRAVIMAALARVGPSSFLRVHAAGFGRLEGRVTGRSDTALVFRADTSITLVPLTGIDSVWARESRAGQGAFVGVLTGGLIGGVLTVIAGSGEPFCGGDEGNCDPKGLLFAKGALVGGAFGALLGAVVGSGHHEWRLRIP